METRDWSYLCELLNQGYPLIEAIQLLDLPAERLHMELSNGKSILEILLQGEKGSFYEYLRFFSNVMSFPDAIDSALSLSSFESKLRKYLLKKSIYPLFILLFAYAMLCFFSIAIIPQMMNSFNQNKDFIELSSFISFIEIICKLFGVFVILLMISMIYLMRHRELCSKLLWKWFRHWRWIQDYESYLFAGYLMQMEKHGVSTRQSMHFFQSIRKDTLFYIFIFHIQKQLEQGMSLKDIITNNEILNKDFIHMFAIASATMKLQQIFSSYMKQQEYRWEERMKKISMIIQIISYVFVGLVVLVVYQMMLVPLSMLEQM